MQVWNFQDKRKRSYYQIFFDGTFRDEMKKLRFLKLLDFLPFSEKKCHRKKSDNTIASRGLEITKLTIFSSFWGPNFGLPRIIFLRFPTFPSPQRVECPMRYAPVTGVLVWERKGARPQKIILRSQIFGLQKLGNNAILRLCGPKEKIVLSVFFRWNFFYRKQKVAIFETFVFFIISSRKVPWRKIW